jgi:sarcosine oxidase
MTGDVRRAPAYDVVVVGLGVMGSAALQHLARRRLRVLGLERYAPGHDRGSSHGQTRIIRLGYYEHPSYVPLLRRAYRLWRELEAGAGTRLLHVTGIAEIGPPDGELVQGTLAAARLHGLPHEILAAGELMRRLPAFRLPAEHVGVLQPDGGFVLAEPAIEAQMRSAQAAGAEVRTGTSVRAIEPRGGHVRVVTGDGVIEAGTAVVTAGAWLPDLLPGLPVALRTTRQVVAWFAPRSPALFQPDRFPVFLLESRHGIHYGFPAVGAAGVKIAKHFHADQAVAPDAVDRTVSAEDEDLIRAAVREHVPAADGPLLSATTCIYTMTPDGDFVLDRLADAPQVIVASPCSGHGFKFAPVIGEILADLAVGGATGHDIARFRLARFAGARAPAPAGPAQPAGETGGPAGS